MNLKFAHIVLNVTDLKRSRIFYEIVLCEFTIIDESEHHVGYSNGQFSVWIADSGKSGNAFVGQATDKAVGVHHFAWKVDTLDELKKWQSYLHEFGIKMSKDGITEDDFGGQGIFFRDPDNNRLEIHLG